MSKYIVAENAEWKMESGEATSIQVTGTYDKITINGNKVYAGTLSAVVSGYTGGSIASNTGSGGGSTQGNSQHNKCPLGNLVLDDIKIPVSLSGSDSSGNPTTGSDNVIIKKVNQDVVEEG